MEAAVFFVRHIPPTFKRELRTTIKLAVWLGIPLTLLLVTMMLKAYVTPADALNAPARTLHNEYTYYCSYWQLHYGNDGKPGPTDCGITDVHVAVLTPPSAADYAKNTYAYGNCTYWAAARRAQLGMPIPNTWGDAMYWAGNAAAQGYQVDRHPTVGSIMQTSAGVGHVAIVERVDTSGAWTISEMNAIGFNQVDYRTLPASAAANYNFIH